MLDRPEGVFGELFTQPDLFGFGLNPALHGFKQMFVHPKAVLFLTMAGSSSLHLRVRIWIVLILHG